MTEQDQSTPRCGFFAVIGAPNAGKSTLVNRLVGAKISIVTPKVQTTRARIRGVLVEDQTQLIFVDTPGIFTPRRRLDRAMVAAAWDGHDGADTKLLVIDAHAYAIADTGDKKARAAARAMDDVQSIIASLKERRSEAILVLNKIDEMPRDRLLKVVAELDAAGCFSETFLISAANGDGVDDLKRRLIELTPEGPWHYPEDQLSDISDRLMAAEITREKLFLRLHQELPYQLTVETTDWTRTQKGELRIDQTIYVSKESHKPIVLGKGGQTIKAIGAAARAEMAEILDEPVHLFLHAKVRENWLNENSRLREMGLEPVD